MPTPVMAQQITLMLDELNVLIANTVQAAVMAAPAAPAPTPTPPAITLNTHEKPGKYKGEKE